jgi:Ca-activated chloride channel family protein
MKPEPAQLLLETDTGEPLLARWRVGLGWSLAWTSDLKNRWAVEWIRWPRWRAFWTQLVREHMRQRRRDELGMRAEMVAGAARRRRRHHRRRPLRERPDERARAPRPAEGNGPETRVALRQTAPGRYEADVPLDRYGAFRLRAVHRRDGRVVAESEGRVSNPYPREYAAHRTGVWKYPVAAVLALLLLDLLLRRVRVLDRDFRGG